MEENGHDAGRAERIESLSATLKRTGVAGEGLSTAVVDGQGKVVGWTESAERVFGYCSSEMLGRSVAMLVAAKDPETTTLAQWARRCRSGRSWTEVMSLRGKDGTRTMVIVEVSPMSRDNHSDWFVTMLNASAGPSTDASLTATLLASSPVGLAVYDAGLRCIWLNDTAIRQDELLRRRRLGRLAIEVFPGKSERSVVAAMRQVLETGDPVIEREYSWQVPGEESERVLSASFFRLDGPDGRPLGVCAVATDIEKSLARQHLLALSEMSSRIGTTLDVLQTAQELADAAVPLLADYVTVDLAESVPLGSEPPLGRLQTDPDRIPVFRRAGAASRRPRLVESICGIGEPVFVRPSSPFTRVLSTGETHFEPYLGASPGTWLDEDPERAAKVSEFGMHSLIIVPLQARGIVLGEMVFVRHDNPTPFSRNELILIEELVCRAALSLDNARRYNHERTAALALQRTLMPRTVEGGPGVELATRYLPSGTHKGVGGDWFDVVSLPDSRVGLIIGDVVGHGINAAALMGRLRTMTATLADLDLPPADVLAKLDRRVALMNDQDNASDGFGLVMTCTCAYVVYDPVSRTCTIASAGHTPPAIVPPDGCVYFPDLPAGPPIGIGGMRYESATFELPIGSIIALYTDGLIESRTADIDTGLKRLSSALSATVADSLEECISHVVHDMTSVQRNVLNGRPDGSRFAEDDIALLFARTRSVLP